MAKIQRNKSNDYVSYRVTLPKDEAEEYIRKYGKDIKVIKCGKGFKLIPMKEE